MAITDKRTALETRPAEFEKRLFFAARNLAIEALLLRIETSMLRKGFDVEAEWRESSRGGPVLDLRLKNPKPSASAWEFAHAAVWISRDRIRVLESQKVSECFYSVASVHSTEDSPHRESKHVQAYRKLVQKMGDDGYFANEVSKVNYPFDYQPHSSY